MNVGVVSRKVAAAVLPRRTILRRRLTSGLVIAGQNKAGHGGRGAFIFGDAAEPELSRLGTLVSNGDTVIDVGASVGLYSIITAQLVGATGVVIAIEPNPEMVMRLDANARRNNLSQIRCRGLAAAASLGPQILYRNNGKPNSFSLVRRDPTAAGLSVLGVPLDLVADWEALTRVDLIKIDAEGSEDGVLAGATEVIERFRPAILAEVAHGGLSVSPPGYDTLDLAGSPNRLLVHREDTRRLRAIDAGWTLNGNARDDAYAP